MSVPGWFGKLPMLGDFAHRRLPAAVVAACDTWLSQGVATSRSMLGEAWLDAYLNAPVWGFAWAPQVIDTQWWRGVLMPSVDAAGRYFPLLVMHARDAAPAATPAQAHWYEAVAACAMTTLSGRVDLAAFEQSLAAIGQEDLNSEPQAQDTVPQAPPATLFALHSLASRLHGHSTWWRLTNDEECSKPWVAQGLPPADEFASFLRATQLPH
jgi:type VI secretion system protein ImpM